MTKENIAEIPIFKEKINNTEYTATEAFLIDESPTSKRSNKQLKKEKEHDFAYSSQLNETKQEAEKSEDNEKK